MRAAKINPMAKAPLPASNASQAVAVRSIPCAADVASVEDQRLRNAGDAKGVKHFPYLVVPQPRDAKNNHAQQFNW
jgi:hypothetical protein